MARLYILIGNEAFAGNTDAELRAYDRESDNPPSSLVKFMKTGEVPPPKPRKRPKNSKKSKKPVPVYPKARRLRTELAQSTKRKGQSELIASPEFDRILAGVTEVDGQLRGGVRFYLTRDNFCQFDGDVTEAEIIDTLRLVVELRRRFGIFAQLADKKTRSRITRLLHGEINELYAVIELCRASMPTEAGYLLADLREQLDGMKLPFDQGD